MTQIMTAAEMTDGQIENAVNRLRDAMRKNRSSITPDVAQQILGVANLGMMMFSPFRERAEEISNLIVRKVLVNRRCSPQTALKKTGYAQSVQWDVVAQMPKGEGSKVELVFFRIDFSKICKHTMSNEDLNKEHELRGLKPADPVSLAAFNEMDPTFVDKRRHATHWKDAEGHWCCAVFRRWCDERRVSIYRITHDWHVYNCWFVGIRKFQ